MKALMALCIIGAVAYTLPASAKETLGTFATNLASLRDDCAKQAQSARDTNTKAEFEAQLDSQKEQYQAKLDAQVYAVGHGGRETTQYYLDRSMAASRRDAAKSKAISDQLMAGEQAVKQCVADAEQKGKNAYAYYKDNRADRKQDKNAESLIVAWMSNLEEISVDTPQGSDATKTAWNTERIKAQL